MLKKHQKITKIKQKNAILMSEKILVTLINKGFSQKYGKNSESIKIRIGSKIKNNNFYVRLFFCL